MIVASSGSSAAVWVLVAVVVILVLLLLSRSVRVIQQGTVGAVKRLGKYRPPVRQPGWTTVIPFLETIQKVDVREEPRVGDMQQVITKDNVSVLVNATIYSQVIDVELALFEVSNYHVAVDQLARTALRAVFGGMTLDEALSERQRINAELQTHMASATEKWGVRLNRIEIVDIVPPQNILNAMALQKEADQQKRAAILQSEGLQQAAINTAQGEKQGSILRAEGDKQSAILRAEGDKEAAIRLGEGRAGAIQPPTTRSTQAMSPPSCSQSCSSRPWAGSPRVTTPSLSSPMRPQG
jgi:regulator of protease activity HflC (stomatin/prohibitin superfamily)